MQNELLKLNENLNYVIINSKKSFLNIQHHFLSFAKTLYFLQNKFKMQPSKQTRSKKPIHFYCLWKSQKNEKTSLLLTISPIFMMKGQFSWQRIISRVVKWKTSICTFYAFSVLSSLSFPLSLFLPFSLSHYLFPILSFFLNTCTFIALKIFLLVNLRLDFMSVEELCFGYQNESAFPQPMGSISPMFYAQLLHT